MNAKPKRRRFPLWNLFAGLSLVLAECVGFASSAAAAENATVITGRVMSDAGDFLPGARVRIWLSPSDYRVAPPTVETVTDAKGRYRATVEVGTTPARVWIGASKAGFRSADSIMRQGGAFTWVSLAPGRNAGASFVLRPGMYVSGQVLDERGMPVADARVTGVSLPANVVSDKLTHREYESTISGRDGRFELFEFPPPQPLKDRAWTGTINVSHVGLLQNVVADVYKLDPSNLTSVRVVLSSGRTISGQVVDEASQPLADTTVEAVFDDHTLRQATVSDKHGKFKIAGLPDRPTTLRARLFAPYRKGKLTLVLDRDHREVMFELRPVQLKSPPNSFDLLGLRVATITPELRDFYDLPIGQGVVILGRPQETSPFNANLKEGDYIWGGPEGTATTGLADLVSRMLRELDTQKPASGEKYHCRLVYMIRRPQSDETPGGELLLDADAIVKLRLLLKTVEAAR